MTTFGEKSGISVLGGGIALPGPAISNLEALRRVEAHKGWSDERLQFAAEGLTSTLGISERHWTHEIGAPLDPDNEESTLELTIEASRVALADAGISAADISLVLATTSTPHKMTSTISAGLGSALGVRAACIDLRGGCSAGIFALGTAASVLQSDAQYVLLAGGETFSKVAPPSYKMAVLALGDGAAALVLGKRDGAALHSVFMETDGNLGGLVTTAGAMPPTKEHIEAGHYQLSGAPEELAETLPGKYVDAIENALERAGLAMSDIDLFVPHQTTQPLLDKLCMQLGFPVENVWNAGIARHANIGAGGWMAALVAARQAGRCGPGSRILVASVGGGMSWGAAVWTL